jgi:hypothetical protein
MAQGVIYDGALRGRHLEQILAAGLIPIVRSPKAPGGGNKEARLGRVSVAGGEHDHVEIQLVEGEPNLIVLDDKGAPIATLLPRTKTGRRANTDGTYRFYSDYAVPVEHGSGTVLLVHRNTKVDNARGFNRPENLRVIPQNDPDWERVAGQRNDSESINGQLKHSLWGKRAHSVGKEAGLFDMLNYGLYVNSISTHRYGNAREDEVTPVAA